MNADELMDSLRAAEDWRAYIDGLGIEGLTALNDALVDKKQAIEMRMGNPDLIGSDGRRADPAAYHQWKYRAKGALSITARQLSHVKARIRDINRAVRSTPLHADGFEGTDALLAAALRIITTLAPFGPPFGREEYATTDAIREHLRSVRAGAACDGRM